ncbi:MAG: methenyltetrahydromethanopterin cyclohydrolase [Candidatus Helarchaeota archaeon]|nr:methenyltetrahydromethanopterin cyclohydrolase [Candidatus Helarchaeota archaeon]
MSVNKEALKIIKEIMDNKERLHVEITQLKNGSTIIDMGVNVPGGFEAGLKMSEVCLGGLATITWDSVNVNGEYLLPALTVATDHPTIACMGSQFAGWRIKPKGMDYFAMASGPCRAKALKEKDLFAELEYKDDVDISIAVLESRQLPNEEVMNWFAEKSGVKPENAYALVAPTASMAGGVQIAARIVETGIHKLHELKFDPKKIVYGFGTTPIAPIAKSDLKAMGMTNDAIIATGSVMLNIKSTEDDNLEELIQKVPSSTSRDYGKTFFQTFKDAGKDFYNIDPLLFAPAVMIINDINTGKNYQAGKLDFDLLKKSFNL